MKQLIQFSHLSLWVTSQGVHGYVIELLVFCDHTVWYSGPG